MFTGLIEEVGTVVSVSMGQQSGSLTISAPSILKDSKVGDSIAVNGVCLTATSIRDNVFTADVMAETFRRSSLGSLKSKSHVNLERAMAADGRFGGHIVSGHIDGTGIVTKIETEENAVWYTIRTSDSILKYIVEKGSIAIDGISLTVAGIGKDSFRVSIIPHTRKETILSEKKAGDIVNLECDVIAKYVERLMGIDKEPPKNGGGISEGFLMEHGFM